MSREYRINPDGEAEFRIEVRHRLNPGGLWCRWQNVPSGRGDGSRDDEYFQAFVTQEAAKQAIREAIDKDSAHVTRRRAEALEAKGRARRTADHARRFPTIPYP